MFRPPLERYNLENGSYYYPNEIPHDKDWVLNKKWVPADSLPEAPGFVNRIVLLGSTPGAKLSIPFEGNAIGIAVLSGPDAGMISWSVDQKPSRVLDLSTAFSLIEHFPLYEVLEQELDASPHVLNIMILSDKNSKSKGTACNIVYLLLNK